jgi:hypothetical protein
LSNQTSLTVLDNHKPDLSSDASSTSTHLQPSDSSFTSYDLSFTDNSDKYTYNGVRTSGDGQYVLIFDPVKKHFVLHRVDSTFDMNLVSAPWDQNPLSLRSEYPQLESDSKQVASAPQRKPSKSAKNAAAAKLNTKRQKQEKPKKPKPPVREPTPEEDSDDGLTVEYPDGPPAQKYQYQPTPVFRRNVSEEASDEDEDAEHESFEEERNQDVDHLQLPSPANNAAGMSDEEIELDLEAELEQALKETENGVDESSESEEE